MEVNHPGHRRRAGLRITERDRVLLAFAAEHRVVLAEQIAAVLEISTASAGTRARALSAAGYLESDRRLHLQLAYQVTGQGLRASASDLTPPHKADLAAFRHDVGVGWLMLAAHNETFGPWRQIVGERHMRSHDQRAEPQPDPFGVRVGGVGPGGRPRLHYPDLQMVTATGHRVAFELELTSKSRRRREDILVAYAADPRVAAVVYLVDDPSVARALNASIRRLDIGSLVRVQPVAWNRERTGAVGRRARERSVHRGPQAQRQLGSSTGGAQR